MTYFTSPMGADHTAGLTYRMPKDKEKQAENSLRSQIQAAACDAFGYCLNSVPGSRSVYPFFADLMNARYGLHLTPDDIMEIGKQTLQDQLAFNEKAEFGKIDLNIPAFLREETDHADGRPSSMSTTRMCKIFGMASSRSRRRKRYGRSASRRCRM